MIDWFICWIAFIPFQLINCWIAFLFITVIIINQELYTKTKRCVSLIWRMWEIPQLMNHSFYLHFQFAFIALLQKSNGIKQINAKIKLNETTRQHHNSNSFVFFLFCFHCLLFRSNHSWFVFAKPFMDCLLQQWTKRENNEL